MARRRTQTRPTPQPMKFDKRLVLNQWLMSLFEPQCAIERLASDGFNLLADPLKDPDLEGFDENNISYFHHVLVHRLWQSENLPKDVLLAYDQNIVRHWKQIARKRRLDGGLSLYPKYFQYLSLLFTEIYLDRYFRDRERLLNDLNLFVERFNERVSLERDSIDPYAFDDLNKIAFWSATGSGKTLLMHCNILQYRYYLKQYGSERELNRIILLTPNEGLSIQHLEEFELSGIEADIFSKDGRRLFAGHAVEIIDIHKLRETSGEKTVAVDAFEGNNLVLVDEGHRGASSAEVGVWMERRNQLCEDGFSFEYSATFGQAMKASGSRVLEQQYCKCILCDYSYKYFYGDGYGKEYRILNLEDDSEEEKRNRYLTAGLLSFYQQQKLFLDRHQEFRPFLIEKPLWIFVGGSVTAKSVRRVGGRDVSDVVDILLFLAGFVRDHARSIELIDRFMKGQSDLLDQRGHDLFAGTFKYLYGCGKDAVEIYQDILKVLFNADSRALLHVENLRGTDGEIALRLGDSEPFGLISVGDAPALCKLCEEHQDSFVVEPRDFSGSYFHRLNDPDSEINVLIGSKKFTEGWSSWRVSCMGLMNVGRNEGSQIIQLFGRGVRLKGKDFCLKRSSRISGLTAPTYLDLMETLQIFGVRANYMRQFKEYLEEEGLPPNDDLIDFRLPVLPTIKDLGSKKLRTVKLQDGVDFKKNGPKPKLEPPSDLLRRHKIVLDWYPKIQSLASRRGMGDIVIQKQVGALSSRQIAFMDIDAIYFEMIEYKNERAWFNFNLSRDAIADLLTSPDWYTLFIPKEELELHRFEQVREWQEIAVALLKKYCDRLYTFRKAEYEQDFLEYRFLDENDPNFIKEYQILVDRSREEIVRKLEELKGLVQSGALNDWQFQNLFALRFSQHLYQPLLHIKNDAVEVKPVSLNEGEMRFVEDLSKHYETHRPFYEGKELYLLRNMSRGRGVGFFEAGNFYPDFILWLLVDEKQFVSFVDPKGLRNIDGPQSPKIQFYQTIKDLERRLADPDVILNSFIISNTPFPDVCWWGDGMTIQDFAGHHVFFQNEQKDVYIQKIFTATMTSSMRTAD